MRCPDRWQDFASLMLKSKDSSRLAKTRKNPPQGNVQKGHWRNFVPSAQVGCFAYVGSLDAKDRRTQLHLFRPRRHHQSLNLRRGYRSVLLASLDQLKFLFSLLRPTTWIARSARKKSRARRLSACFGLFEFLQIDDPRLSCSTSNRKTGRVVDGSLAEQSSWVRRNARIAPCRSKDTCCLDLERRSGFSLSPWRGGLP